MKRRILLIGLMVTLGAQAQPVYPNRPIRLIVPFGAGGVTDSVARVIAEELAKDLGQTMVVENQGGAGGAIGTARVAKLPGDGYSLMFTTSAHVINSVVRKKLSYDPIKDFTPIALVANVSTALVVKADSPYKTIQDYVAAAKADPGGVTYASPGVGTPPQFLAEQFAQATGTKYTQIPYTTTTAMVQSVLAGDIKSTWTSTQSASEFVRAGSLRVLGVASTNRSAFVPEAPTFIEQGFAGFVGDAWMGLLGPAGVPKAVADKIMAAVVAATKNPDVVARLKAVGMDRVEPITGDAFQKIIIKDIETSTNTARAANMPYLD